MKARYDTEGSPVERARLFMTAMNADSNYVGHDGPLFRHHAKLISAALPSEVPFPTVVVRVTIADTMSNRGGNLHGGMTATIFDCITTIPLTLVAREGFWVFGGVSRNLSVTYLKAVQVGDEIDVTAELINAGARLACIRGTMKRVSDGAVVATCVHDKANTDPPPTKL